MIQSALDLWSTLPLSAGQLQHLQAPAEVRWHGNDDSNTRLHDVATSPNAGVPPTWQPEPPHLAGVRQQSLDRTMTVCLFHAAMPNDPLVRDKSSLFSVRPSHSSRTVRRSTSLTRQESFKRAGSSRLWQAALAVHDKDGSPGTATGTKVANVVSSGPVGVTTRLDITYDDGRCVRLHLSSRVHPTITHASGLFVGAVSQRAPVWYPDMRGHRVGRDGARCTASTVCMFGVIVLVGWDASAGVLADGTQAEFVLPFLFPIGAADVTEHLT
jgi:hypothetical protein